MAFPASPIPAGTPGHIVDHEEIHTLLNTLAVNVKDPDFGAKGDGVTDDTVALHAARDSGAKRVFVPDGTYITTGITLNVAIQEWVLSPGATIKLANAANSALVTVTSDDVTVSGRGVFEGNGTNQTAGGQGFIITGADRFLAQEFEIKNCRQEAFKSDGDQTDIRILNVRMTNNGLANLNLAPVYFFTTNGSITGVTVKGCHIDSWGKHIGCVKLVSIVAGRTIDRVNISDNTLLVGAAVADAADTLGIEMFGHSGGSYNQGTISGNTIIGENNTNTKIFGISLGGIATSTTTGLFNYSVSGNVLRDCRSHGIEVIGRNVSVSGNVLTGSGEISVAATSMTGDIFGVSISGNSIYSPTDTAYVFRMQAGANAIRGLVVAANVVYNAPGSVFTFESGTHIGTVIEGNHVHTSAGVAVAFNSGVTVTDPAIVGNYFNLTGAAASIDVISNNATGTTNLLVSGNVFLNATRHGVFSNVALVGAQIVGNRIYGCTSDGIRTSAGCDRWLIDENWIHNNGGTGIILAGSPTNILVGDTNHVYSNTVGQTNLGSATLVGTTVNGPKTYAEGANEVFGTATGTKIGTATTQKIGFYGGTPIVQPAGVADASGGATIDAEARAAINALISRMESLGLVATV